MDSRSPKALVEASDSTFYEEGSLRSLIEKYAGNTPRYTSYPTAVEFRNDIGHEQWKETLEIEVNNPQNQFTPSLYVHLPFCTTLCYFCACNKKIAKDDAQVGPYLKSLGAELSSYRDICGEHPLEQLHWGGGTPNFFSPSASEDLFRICTEAFPGFADGADISVEIDPRTLTSKHLETYKSLGFNRVSLGVQDFNPDVQEAINRIQPYSLTKQAIDGARSLGFSSVNFDLIYGLPLQTEESFRNTVERVVELMPERIALYGYAHVTWKKKVQKTLQRHDLPSPAERINLFLLALETLSQAGYEYIGMDHFALPQDSLTKARASGRLNRNFMGYSTHQGTSVIGAGVSAISSTDSMLAQNNTNLEHYMELALSQGIVTQGGLRRSREDQLRGELIENILCIGEIDIKSFEEKWNLDFHSEFSPELESLRPMEEDNLVTIRDKKIEVSSLGRLFMRNIASVFDSYLAKHKSSSTFSQSV
jgi:oxygen-independent coproporphyrinogen-3 oxidase